MTPTDCVKDRLAAYYYWSDRQSFEQAVMVAKQHEIDMDDIQKWTEKEGKLEEFKSFQDRIL